MFDWSKDDLATLPEIAHETGQSPELRNFAAYCLQESGKHETEAFASLRLFLNDVEHWEEEDRRSFVDWVLRVQHNHPTLHNLVHPTLHHELVEPVMHQWKKDAQDDAKRLRWSDRLEELERARELAPDDTVIQRRLVEMLIRRIEADCGHLPEEYPGHPMQDKAMLEEAITLLQGLENRTRHDDRLLDRAHDLQQKLTALLEGGQMTVIDVDIPEEDL